MKSLYEVKLTTGRVLKALRNRHGYTQKDICTTIGLSTSNLSALENDKRNLGVELAAKLSVLYGTRIESLLFPNGLKSMKGYKSLVKKVERLQEVA